MIDFFISFKLVSTVMQLVHAIYEALEEGNEMRAVFLDLSKAFDRVWHRGLIAKLRSIGIKGNLLNWFIMACLHGGEGPQVGEVTRLGGVTRLSILSLSLI